MKRSLLFISLALAFTACKNGPAEQPASMEVTPESLTFNASGDAPKTITVAATGVDWDFVIPDKDKEWLKAEKSDGGLSVSVTDNAGLEARNGQIRIEPDNTALLTETVLVSQSGIAYTFEADKTALTFAGEDDAPQEVTVKAEGENLSWTFTVDAGGREWVDAQQQGDKIVVTVKDNPKYSERTAKITVKPSVEGLENIVITVTQTESTIDPYLRADKSELLFEGIDKDPQTINVECFGVSWTPALKAETGDGGIDWFNIDTDKAAGTVTVTVKRNMTGAVRKGYIILNPSDTSVEAVTITVMQEVGDLTLSTLTEDTVLPQEMLEGYALLKIQKDQPDYQEYTEITIRIYDENVSMDNMGVWHGTGGRLEMTVYCERLEGDGYNYMPSVTYEVDDYQEFGPDGVLYAYPTVYAGSLSAMGRQKGSWYTYYENDVEKYAAPITLGDMTVSRDGDVYTIEFAFEDDAQNKITGTFSREFTDVEIVDNL